MRLPVKQRIFNCLIHWLFVALFLPCLPALAADGVDIVQARMNSTEEGYQLVLSSSFDLGRSLEDAVLRGIPLSFCLFYTYDAAYE